VTSPGPAQTIFISVGGVEHRIQAAPGARTKVLTAAEISGRMLLPRGGGDGVSHRNYTGILEEKKG
jgi:hypothetical protein